MASTIPLAAVQRSGMELFYRPGSVDEIVIRESFEGDKYLATTPEYKARTTDIIIDIGAHIGTFSMMMSSAVHRIYAFEASAETFDILQKNVSHNHLHNVKVFHCAVAKQTGTVTLFHDLETGNWGHSITNSLSGVGEQVPAISLEEIIDKENIAVIDLIKFNCEGAEFDILLNTQPAYLQKIKVMAIQYHENLAEGHTAAGLMQYLRGMGFRVVHRYRYKESGNGWITAYRAGFLDNLSVKLKALPLSATLLSKELLRKCKRAIYIVTHFKR